MYPKIKLLYVIEQDRPSRFYEEFFARLKEQDEFAVYIYNLHQCEALNIQLKPYIEEIFDPPSSKKYRQQIPYLRNLIKKLKPDIIHCHETIPAFYACLSTLGLGKKLIYHRHHSFYHNQAKKMMDMVATVLATKVICVSKASLQKAVSEHPVFKRKFGYIYNGVKLENPLPYQFEQEDTEKIKVLFLARLKPRKGHLQALRIAREIISEFSNIVFYFAGDGELKDSIQNEINSLSLTSSVKLLGNVPNVSGLLQGVDIVILPSESEAFSLTVLETLAAHRLLIASHLPSIKEVITHKANGILLDPFDTMAWANAIIEYSKNKSEASKLASEGYKTFESHFTMSKMVKNFSCFYKQLVDKQ